MWCVFLYYGISSLTHISSQIPQVNLEAEESEFLDQSWLYNKRLQALQAQDPNHNPVDYDYDTGKHYLTENELVEKKVEIYFKNEQFQVRLTIEKLIGALFQDNFL